MVSGPAGIGKTRLLSEVAALLADEGWQVGSGTAVPDDRLAPMAALRSALRTLLPASTDPFSVSVGPTRRGVGLI